MHAHLYELLYEEWDLRGVCYMLSIYIYLYIHIYIHTYIHTYIHLTFFRLRAATELHTSPLCCIRAPSVAALLQLKLLKHATELQQSCIRAPSVAALLQLKLLKHATAPTKAAAARSCHLLQQSCNRAATELPQDRAAACSLRPHRLVA
jgi:hypothetical protein